MLDFFLSVLGAIFSTTVKTVVAVVASLSSTRASVEISTIEARIQRDKGFDRLHEINEELEALRRQSYKNTSEIKRLDDLLERRKELNKSVSEKREIIARDVFLQKQDGIKEVVISSENFHILQWNAFADVVSKVCPRCNRRMKVQWSNNHYRPEFFWGCIGFYGGYCKYTQPLSQYDLKILTDISSEELQLSTQDFESIVKNPSMQKHIIQQVSDLSADLQTQNRGVDIVCCPIHGQPMLLSEKKNNVSGLLDRYHLKCPHYAVGCSYTEKLKSGAQLAALLKHETGRGIL